MPRWKRGDRCGCHRHRRRRRRPGSRQRGRAGPGPLLHGGAVSTRDSARQPGPPAAPLSPAPLSHCPGTRLYRCAAVPLSRCPVTPVAHCPTAPAPHRRLGPPRAPAGRFPQTSALRPAPLPRSRRMHTHIHTPTDTHPTHTPRHGDRPRQRTAPACPPLPRPSPAASRGTGAGAGVGVAAGLPAERGGGPETVTGKATLRGEPPSWLRVHTCTQAQPPEVGSPGQPRSPSPECLLPAPPAPPAAPRPRPAVCRGGLPLRRTWPGEAVAPCLLGAGIGGSPAAPSWRAGGGARAVGWALVPSVFSTAPPQGKKQVIPGSSIISYRRISHFLPLLNFFGYCLVSEQGSITRSALRLEGRCLLSPSAALNSLSSCHN